MKLDDERRIIDDIDNAILALLNRRGAVSRRIGVAKARAGLPIADVDREESVIRRLQRESSGEIDAAALTNIYREILRESRRIQVSMVSIGEEACK